MKKLIFTLFVACGSALVANAQSKVGGISAEMLKEIQK